MNENLEQLQEIGSQKIYEDTHIPIGHIESILNEDFKRLSKLQFLGFISIIEREYNCDLSELRVKGNNYFDEVEKNREVVINESIYKAPSAKSNLLYLYIGLAAVVFVAALLYSIFTNSTSTPLTDVNTSSIQKETEVESTSVNKSKQKTTLKESEENLSAITDQNISAVEDENNSVVEEDQKALEQKELALEPESLDIITKRRVWLGYIDVTDNKRYQKTFSGKLSLDPSKEWLLYFGHGHVGVSIDGETKQFNERNPLRLHYKNGELQKISLREFKRINKGRKW